MKKREKKKVFFPCECFIYWRYFYIFEYSLKDTDIFLFFRDQMLAFHVSVRILHVLEVLKQFQTIDFGE